MTAVGREHNHSNHQYSEAAVLNMPRGRAPLLPVLAARTLTHGLHQMSAVATEATMALLAVPTLINLRRWRL